MDLITNGTQSCLNILLTQLILVELKNNQTFNIIFINETDGNRENKTRIGLEDVSFPNIFTTSEKKILSTVNDYFFDCKIKTNDGDV
ncbi:hypothetical protein BpHYR1_035085 [Brachionus plicatilis]|uniref:Uncharacterized protein n=1 Tax=Brachionus plicatilis TaxID=10195 RepID=A0A3M7SZ27_BRAPC|nr:hypothetical protein BpHYR1_035085 [Brachionus plicatilis]